MVSTQSQPLRTSPPGLAWAGRVPPRGHEGLAVPGFPGLVLGSFEKPFPGLQRGRCPLSGWLKRETQTPLIEPSHRASSSSCPGPGTCRWRPFLTIRGAVQADCSGYMCPSVSAQALPTAHCSDPAGLGRQAFLAGSQEAVPLLVLEREEKQGREKGDEKRQKRAGGAWILGAPWKRGPRRCCCVVLTGTGFAIGVLGLNPSSITAGCDSASVSSS